MTKIGQTDRGFNLWGTITNDRMEKIMFQESSAFGLNTWLRVKPVKDLNHGTLVASGSAPVETLEYGEEAMIHLELKDLLKLQRILAEVIEYQINERLQWYDD